MTLNILKAASPLANQAKECLLHKHQPTSHIQLIITNPFKSSSPIHALTNVPLSVNCASIDLSTPINLRVSVNLSCKSATVLTYFSSSSTYQLSLSSTPCHNRSSRLTSTGSGFQVINMPRYQKIPRNDGRINRWLEGDGGYDPEDAVEDRGSGCNSART